MIEITSVLCPVDFSDFSRRALEHASAIARWYDARLTVLHVIARWPAAAVIPPLEAGVSARPLAEVDRSAAKEALKGFAGAAAQGIRIEYVVADSADVVREILAQAAKSNADLLVIGSHGHSGFERLLLGSITEKTMRKASCPVMIVPVHAPQALPDEPIQFKRIVCPVDFSEGSTNALNYALDIAKQADAHLTVMHAIEIPPELSHIPRNAAMSADFNVDQVRAAAEAECLERLRSLIPKDASEYCTVETTVSEGSAYRQILNLAAAQKAQLIVMGVQGHSTLDLFVFGSNTEQVVRRATCPVITVPASPQAA